jgi:competence protein ComEC
VSTLGLEFRSNATQVAELSAAFKSHGEVTIRVIVTGDPRRTKAKVHGQYLKASRVLVPVRVEELRSEKRLYRVRFPAPAFFDEINRPLVPGECLVVAGNLGGFPDRRPLVRVDQILESCGPPSVLQRAAFSVRESLKHASERLPVDAQGLLPGLVVGDTSGLSSSLENDMRAVNLTHLTAVSGANLAIVAAFVLGLSRGVGLRRQWVPISVALAIAFFVLIARPEPSVLRAAVMAMVLIIGRALGSPHAAFTALAFAVSFLLLINPAQGRSPGFALSVAATSGLILWVGPLTKYLNRFMSKWLAIGLAVPIAAQLACTPILVALSGEVSLLGVITNFLAAPLVAPATILGLIAAIVGLIHLPLATLIAMIAGLPVIVIAAVARLGADIPFATVPLPQGGVGAAIALVASVGLVLGLRWRRRQTMWVVIPLLISVIVLAVLQPGWPMPRWAFAVCDVGQGDGLVVRTSEREAMVVDVGPDGRSMLECLHRLKVEEISVLAITHPHADHMEGLPDLLDQFSVDVLLLPQATEEGEQHDRLLQMVAAQNIRFVKAGDRITTQLARIEVLWPRFLIEQGSIANNASLVMLITVQDARLLLLGDVEAEAQASLPNVGHVDLVKVAHHGSSNQSFEYLTRLKPDVSIISVGRGNPYGHPHPRLLQFVERHGGRVYRTDLHGAVAVSWAKGMAAIRTRGQPFWAPRR